MSENERDRRNLPAQRRATMPAPGEPRSVGIQVGDTIYVPALPANAHDSTALGGYINAHARAVIAMDYHYACAAAFAARRVVIRNPGAEIEAERDQQEELDHQRTLARKRREREAYEAELQIVQARHRVEAAEVFRDQKFETGTARYAEKIAKFRVGEAVARASMGEEILEPEAEQVGKRKSSSTAEMLALLADDLEKQIDEAEATGRPTEELRTELKSINTLLRRELLKSAGR